MEEVSSDISVEKLSGAGSQRKTEMGTLQAASSDSGDVPRPNVLRYCSLCKQYGEPLEARVCGKCRQLFHFGCGKDDDRLLDLDNLVCHFCDREFSGRSSIQEYGLESEKSVNKVTTLKKRKQIAEKSKEKGSVATWTGHMAAGTSWKYCYTRPCYSTWTSGLQLSAMMSKSFPLMFAGLCFLAKHISSFDFWRLSVNRNKLTLQDTPRQDTSGPTQEKVSSTAGKQPSDCGHSSSKEASSWRGGSRAHHEVVKLGMEEGQCSRFTEKTEHVEKDEDFEKFKKHITDRDGNKVANVVRVRTRTSIRAHSFPPNKKKILSNGEEEQYLGLADEEANAQVLLKSQKQRACPKRNQEPEQATNGISIRKQPPHSEVASKASTSQGASIGEKEGSPEQVVSKKHAAARMHLGHCPAAYKILGTNKDVAGFLDPQPMVVPQERLLNKRGLNEALATDENEPAGFSKVPRVDQPAKSRRTFRKEAGLDQMPTRSQEVKTAGFHGQSDQNNNAIEDSNLVRECGGRFTTKQNNTPLPAGAGDGINKVPAVQNMVCSSACRKNGLKDMKVDSKSPPQLQNPAYIGINGLKSCTTGSSRLPKIASQAKRYKRDEEEIERIFQLLHSAKRQLCVTEVFRSRKKLKVCISTNSQRTEVISNYIRQHAEDKGLLVAAGKMEGDVAVQSEEEWKLDPALKELFCTKCLANPANSQVEAANTGSLSKSIDTPSSAAMTNAGPQEEQRRKTTAEVQKNVEASRILPRIVKNNRTAQNSYAWQAVRTGENSNRPDAAEQVPRRSRRATKKTFDKIPQQIFISSRRRSPRVRRDGVHHLTQDGNQNVKNYTHQMPLQRDVIQGRQDDTYYVQDDKILEDGLHRFEAPLETARNCQGVSLSNQLTHTSEPVWCQQPWLHPLPPGHRSHHTPAHSCRGEEEFLEPQWLPSDLVKEEQIQFDEDHSEEHTGRGSRINRIFRDPDVTSSPQEKFLAMRAEQAVGVLQRFVQVETGRVLEQGWRATAKMRKKQANNRIIDFYYHSPDGCRFRSKNDVVRKCRLDWAEERFSVTPDLNEREPRHRASF